MNLRIAPLAAVGLAALAGANLWLLTIILAGGGDGESVPAAPLAWGDVKWSGPGKTDVAAKPISAYGQILAQPVFFKTREPYIAPPPRPAPAAVPAVAAKPAPPPIVDPGFAVAGIIIAQGMRKAYVHGKSDPHGNWVSEGESLTGWKVQAIDADGVKLQQQDRTIELQLYLAITDDPAPAPLGPSPRGIGGPALPLLKQNPSPPAAGR